VLVDHVVGSHQQRQWDREPEHVWLGSCVTSIARPHGNAQLYGRWRRALRGRQSGADLKPPQAALVKSDGERCGNAGTRFRQARSREASASEPLQKRRKRISCHDRLGPPGGMKREYAGAPPAQRLASPWPNFNTFAAISLAPSMQAIDLVQGYLSALVHRRLLDKRWTQAASSSPSVRRGPRRGGCGRTTLPNLGTVLTAHPVLPSPRGPSRNPHKFRQAVKPSVRRHRPGASACWPPAGCYPSPCGRSRPLMCD
jgi:hypothetical protein